MTPKFSPLPNHPEVEVINRDLSGLYAPAVRQGAPQAVQVADRFHIVRNLRMVIKEQMNLQGRATGRLLFSDADNNSTASHLLRSRLAHRKFREEICTTIHALRRQVFPAVRSRDEPGSRVVALQSGWSSRRHQTAGGQR